MSGVGSTWLHLFFFLTMLYIRYPDLIPGNLDSLTNTSHFSHSFLTKTIWHCAKTLGPLVEDKYTDQLHILLRWTYCLLLIESQEMLQRVSPFLYHSMATFPAYILIFKFVKYSRTSDFLDIVFFPTLMSYFHCLGDFTAHRDIDMKLYNTELRYILKLYFKPLSILFTL